MTDTEQSSHTLPLAAGDLPDPVAARYEFLEELGHGGMGVVFRGRHRQLEKTVAIKVIRSGLESARFLREARLLARIDSPHVVRVHDFDILPSGDPMLVMELIEGSDLRHVIEQRRGPLDEGATLQWMRQVASGLLSAAEQGIVHRDIKPSNIRIDRNDQARIMDFGLSRAAGDGGSLTISDSWLGTPYYMAPEQAESPRSVDTRADIYSFGATFYHALTGTAPFTGESAFSVLFKHKTEPLVAPRSINPRLSPQTSELLERCLAKSPDHRFPSFHEVLRCLAPQADPPSPWEPINETELQPYLDQFQRNRAAHLQRSNSPDFTDQYLFPGGRTLSIVRGNIVNQSADAIVSSDNSHLTMDYGCSLEIFNAAGPDVYELAKQFVPVLPGRVVVTPAGKLSARFIFHAATNGYAGRVFRASRDIIAELVSAILYHADTLSLTSLALPLLGAGGARLASDVALDAIFLALVRNLHRGLTSVRDIRLVLYASPKSAASTNASSNPPTSSDS